MDAVTFQKEAMRIEKLLYRISWSYLKVDADCADAVQEALTHAWEKQNTLKNPEQFKPWLIRILTNQCKDMLRKRKYQSFYPLDENTAVYPPPSEPCSVMEKIDQLRPEQRVVIVLHYVDGYSTTEISSMLGLPHATVKSRLLRARRHLQAVLRVEWEEFI